VGPEDLPEPDKRPNDRDIHLDGALAVQDACEHEIDGDDGMVLVFHKTGGIIISVEQRPLIAILSVSLLMRTGILKIFHAKHARSAGFTLIELLVVIAIIAVLAVVVVLTLNPAELLRQSRDANRVSDMSTLTSALNLYSADQSGSASFNMGSSSVVYVSIPDPAATSTAGTNCSSLGLATLPSIYIYHCASSSTYRNVNGAGWIPVNLMNISSGAPLGDLPVDPTNNSSSRLYYTYTTNGTQYEVTSVMESQKYQVAGSNDVISSDGGPLASVYEKGSKLGLEPLDYGDPTLAGYWPLNEGTSSIAYDDSGNNATGSWQGSQIGTNGYYTTNAKTGSYAGGFDGLTTYISIPQSPSLNIQGSLTISAWIYPTSWLSGYEGIVSRWGSAQYLFEIWSNETMSFYLYGGGSQIGTYTTAVMPVNQWVNVVGVYNQNSMQLYYNGVQNGSPVAFSQGLPSTSQATIIGYGGGTNQKFPGYINDVRIYNRALSSAQIAAMYKGGK